VMNALGKMGRKKIGNKASRVKIIMLSAFSMCLIFIVVSFFFYNNLIFIALSMTN